MVLTGVVVGGRVLSVEGSIVTELMVSLGMGVGPGSVVPSTRAWTLVTVGGTEKGARTEIVAHCSK